MENTEITIIGGRNVSRYTTEELAKYLVFLTPGQVITVITSQKDTEHDAQANPWPWYSATIVKLIENYQLFFEQCIKDSDRAFVYPLPMFDMDREKYPDKATDTVMQGLKRFAELYGIEKPDTWYVDTKDFDYVTTQWNGEKRK